MSKTKKYKIEDQENLLANFVFLKVVIYAMLLAQTILHHKLILHQQSAV